ncbi:MAG: hypothetical protein H6597_03710 [Flavobacteriales bacterium]|nr:hypothetical protein [Flavobacteriales bacterium]MCB9193615.1 hypothetical protein [Flavobacteriales bacterium]
MGPFIRRAVLFLLMLAGIAFGLDRLLKAGLRERTTDVYGVWNRIIRGNIQSDVLFCGSSRTLVHFDAAHISEHIGRTCYNIGMDGTQLDLQLARLRTFLRHCPPPRVLLQEVDIISLTPESRLYFGQQYLPYLNEPAVRQAVYRIEPDGWMDRWVPLHGFMRYDVGSIYLALQGLLHLEDTLHDPVHLGFELRDRAWEGSFDHFLEQHPDGIRYPTDTAAQRTLRTIVRTAQDAGAQVVLCYAPELVENQRITLDRNEIMGIYQQIAKEADIPFWDFSNSAFCNDRDYFYNSQHMNAKGVALFTSMIADSLSSLPVLR